MVASLISVFDVYAKNPSFAYLDPGTGSLLIQFLVGGVAAVGISIKVFWKQIKGVFTNKKDKRD